jgi:uncharacterized membrane protein YbhN (UPF0104 family)
VSPLAAHLVCLTLVAADLQSRILRLNAFLRGLGHPISQRESLITNLLADAGSALTPLRLGGEPGRILGLFRAGVPAAAVFSTLGIEVIVTWPLTLLVGAGLAAAWAPQWLQVALPGLIQSARHHLPLLVGIALLCLLAVPFGWAWLRVAGHRPVRSFRRVLVYWRRMPRSVLLVSVPLTLVNILARTALLPVLALSEAVHPPLGVMLVGSFGLVYSQLFLPTPSGVGAVELGFFGGAAGEFGIRETELLLWWRFYSVGLTAVLGVFAALRLYGRVPLMRGLTQVARRGRQGGRADERTSGRADQTDGADGR